MMNLKTNAWIKLLYKQRFFNFVINNLKNKFNLNNNQSKCLYLSLSLPCDFTKSLLFFVEFKISYVTALSITLRFLPRNIVQQQLPTMLPMLVYSLSNNQKGDENLWLCTLKSVEDLITQSAVQTKQKSTNDNHLIDYLPEILKELFNLSKLEANMV